MVKMLKNILGAVLLTMFLVSGINAGECSESDYSYYNGHRSVHPNNSFSKSDSKNIRVCSDSDVSSLWNVAIQKAINQLNYNLGVLNTSLHYSYASSNCTINVENSGNLSNNLYAKVAPFSISGRMKAGDVKILINIDNTNLRMNKMRTIFMHELLHGVGFMHTGTNILYEIPNTDGYFDTKYAGRSFMCSSYLYPQRYFNFLDQRAIESLYPK